MQENLNNKKICVYGMWHLGCVTAACLAEKGFSVIGLDTSDDVVAELNNGKAPLFEPNLNSLIQDGLDKGKLSFSSDLQKALLDADIVWVTFDTPVDDNDKADVLFLEHKIIDAAKHMKDGSGMIISSQVPAGFAASMEKKLNHRIKIAYSPENLRLGEAISIFQNPDRIIIGTRAEDKEFFEPVFLAITDKLIWMKTESAEMVKHSINSFLAMSVSFTNEIAEICEKIGADAIEVEAGLKSEYRIGKYARVHPGLSFAGGTLARDINFLIDLGKKNDVDTKLISSVRESNNLHKEWVKKQLKNETMHNQSVAVIGLAYKSNTSTLRRSLGLELCSWLIEQGANIHVFDEHVKSLPSEFSKVNVHQNIDDAINKSKIIILLTGSAQLIIKNDKLDLLNNKFVLDPNHFLEKFILDNKKFHPSKYLAVGRIVK